MSKPWAPSTASRSGPPGGAPKSGKIAFKPRSLSPGANKTSVERGSGKSGSAKPTGVGPRPLTATGPGLRKGDGSGDSRAAGEKKTFRPKGAAGLGKRPHKNAKPDPEVSLVFDGVCVCA